MENKQNKWEQILKIMETSMKPHKFDLWISDLELIKVDDELQAIFVSARDPFKGAYAMKQYGENLDKAAEIIFGAGYSVYVTYDKRRVQEDDNLSVRSNEFTLVESNGGYKHRVRMLLLTNTDIDDDELDNVIIRMQKSAKRDREYEEKIAGSES